MAQFVISAPSWGQSTGPFQKSGNQHKPSGWGKEGGGSTWRIQKRGVDNLSLQERAGDNQPDLSRRGRQSTWPLQEMGRYNQTDPSRRGGESIWPFGERQPTWPVRERGAINLPSRRCRNQLTSHREEGIQPCSSRRGGNQPDPYRRWKQPTCPLQEKWESTDLARIGGSVTLAKRLFIAREAKEMLSFNEGLVVCCLFEARAKE